ncbi:1,4-dihydroxy-2-naphthoate prenyltransferase [Chishuiella changwenlii]|uniref:1,4-dihydroxy-2-naphthoate octaprenyltransferase n=1 Tax=Chishuiella changwenlii TaxID=1434701 RepID=A0A1M6Y1F4_9FLAO|nr:1,4-dihydroxy-2-naphthoate octaprenyltransferase [Chishuiella changwenlii]GGE93821.1 1,4-dihydroxy-2-naphthoate octaprenyltransferase [Chishuiella changwenlii]SHL12081.1 1,4-dihydroxy-2-naphthoate prenyltransferase [Chishuiella changwenlii]
MKKWILAARLRTLPLSLSGLLLAGFIAKSEGIFRNDIFFLSLLTTLAFQILSNFANDYGDAVKGTDANRIGEQRAVASGLITKGQMKTAIAIMVIISIICVCALLYVSFYPDNLNYIYIFFGLGVASILAAMAYTMGKKPYGYIGLGDVFVFLFFGILAVTGGEFLYSKSFQWEILLPAASMGFWSVAVLNLNNMRDVENDIKNNKITVASRLGFQRSKYYQMTLMTLPFVFSALYVTMSPLKSGKISGFVFLVLIFFANAIRRQIFAVKNPKDFDPFLKQVAMLALFFAVLLGYSLIGFEFIDTLIR